MLSASVKSWRFSGTSVQQSAHSGRQQVTMSRHQSVEICSNRSSCRIRGSRSKHREIVRDAKEDAALHCLRVTIQYSNQLWKVLTGRTHTIWSTETSSQSALCALPLDRSHDKFLFNIMMRSSGNRTRAGGHLQWMASTSPRRCHVHGGQM